VVEGAPAVVFGLRDKAAGDGVAVDVADFSMNSAVVKILKS
jgi:hypothetical protein